MPHIPKKPRYASFGPGNEPKPKQAVQMRTNSGAVQGPGAGKHADTLFEAPDLGQEKLSLVRFEVPPERVFEHLFGRDFNVDEHSGLTVVPGINS